MENESYIFNEHGAGGRARPITYKVLPDECWVQTSHTKDKDGYGVIKRFGKKMSMNRYICLLTHGCPITFQTETWYARLSCGNSQCVNPDHLYWDKRTNDIITKTKTRKKWKKPSNHKLDYNTAQQIHDLLSKTYVSYKQIKEWYGIDTTTISNINNGRIWADKEKQYPLRAPLSLKQKRRMYSEFKKQVESNGLLLYEYQYKHAMFRVDTKWNFVEHKCSTCNLWKNIHHFTKEKDDFTFTCKICNRLYFLQYNHNNSSRIKTSRQEYYIKNKLKINKRNREYRKNNWIETKHSIAKWHLAHPDSKHRYYIERESRAALLPCNLSTREYHETVLSDFLNMCALTESTTIHMEHFIPTAIGHGGTTIQNCYPLDGDLNASKHSSNPFEWVKRPDIQAQVDMAKWNKLISYLSQQNKLSVDEFKDYVYWCFDNPRSLEDLKRDNTPSIDLWRQYKHEEVKSNE